MRSSAVPSVTVPFAAIVPLGAMPCGKSSSGDLIVETDSDAASPAAFRTPSRWVQGDRELRAVFLRLSNRRIDQA